MKNNNEQTNNINSKDYIPVEGYYTELFNENMLKYYPGVIYQVYPEDDDIHEAGDIKSILIPKNLVIPIATNFLNAILAELSSPTEREFKDMDPDLLHWYYYYKSPSDDTCDDLSAMTDLLLYLCPNWEPLLKDILISFNNLKEEPNDPDTVYERVLGSWDDHHTPYEQQIEHRNQNFQQWAQQREKERDEHRHALVY